MRITSTMQPPTHLLNNRYSVVRTIGQGGMGAVFEAIDTRLGNHVAIKQTLNAVTTTNSAFEHEARLLARLHHPVLPVVSDFFIDNGAQFIVMQYIPGDDLAMLLIQRGQPFSLADVLQWADALLDALEYLHTQHPPVIHRDIKPHNLKLNGRGNIILLDFGISKGGTATSVLAKSVLAYTPDYAPLEQIQQIGTTANSDLYALGGTLHQLLTGHLPPSALERAVAKLNNLSDPYQAAHKVNPSVPPAVGFVLSQALALNTNDRYQSAADMRRAFQSTAYQGMSSSTSPVPVAAHAAAPVAATTAASTGVTMVLGTPQAPQQPIAKQSLSAAGLVKSQAQQLSRPPVTPLSPSQIWKFWALANMIWIWAYLPITLLGPATVVLVGVIAGVAQWLVLRRTTWRAVTKRWLIATIIAGPIALFTAVVINSSFDLAPTLSWTASGMVGGAIIGAAQWWAFRHRTRVNAMWILAQILGWALVVLLCSISIGFVLIAGLVSGTVGGAALYGIAQLESRVLGKVASSP